MNKHSFKHGFNSLGYKKIFFLKGFCLSGKNLHRRTAGFPEALFGWEGIVHYPGTATS